MKIKKLLRLFTYLVLSIVGFVALYLLVAFCLSRITLNREASTASDVDIYILTNGVHTDIVVPVKSRQMDWSREIKFSNTRSNDSAMQYLALGWGDKGFYLETPTWADLKFKTAFKAAFGLDHAAMHATFYRRMVESKTCKRIPIAAEQYERLLDFLSASFQKDENGHTVWINTTANYSATDAFYEATGKYSMARTCNSWANEALKACGQKCCLWTAFDTAIFAKYE